MALEERMTLSITLSHDQQEALDRIVDWYRDGTKQALTFGGYAGTGKTTLIGEFNRLGVVDKNIGHVAFTGKAANVMRGKLQAAGFGGALVSTIHRLLYIPRVTIMCRMSEQPTTFCEAESCEPCKDDTKYEVTSWEKRLPSEIDPAIEMLIVDEASMVDADIWNDLLALERPILAVGDHFQLPPINKDPGIMRHPDIRLEKIHRQAEGSAIIRMATHVRENHGLPFGSYGDGADKIRWNEFFTRPFNPNALMLCGMNRTRLNLNAQQRKMRGYTGVLQPGERIIALKNDYQKGLFNGMVGTVTSVGEQNEFWIEAEAEMDGGVKYKGRMSVPQFFAEKTTKFGDPNHVRFVDQFTHAYTLSVHKAQGSQADDVVLVEEKLPGNQEKHARWLYTGVTRAAERVTVVA